jgi:hypothetical protein
MWGEGKEKGIRADPSARPKTGASELLASRLQTIRMRTPCDALSFIPAEGRRIMDLADRLETLRHRYREPWEVKKEPHGYPDGTKEFTHVRYHAQVGDVDVLVATYVTPELAELLCLLHNNLDEIIAALRDRTSGQLRETRE